MTCADLARGVETVRSDDDPGNGVIIRDAHPVEFRALGQLMVHVYSSLDGFPGPADQPGYYEMLADIGAFASKPATRLLVAADRQHGPMGGVVYFGDMAAYGSGGTATSVRNASGIRLLAVDPRHRGAGVGGGLTRACVEVARSRGHSEVILHTTAAMQTAWRLYERLGFARSADLDFLQQGLPVFGFRLKLQ